MRSKAHTSTDAAWWAGDPVRSPVSRFEGAERSSCYVPMSDGTRIAIDIYLPKGLRGGDRVPTIIVITPYFRSIEFRSRFLDEFVGKRNRTLGRREPAQFAQFGYATVFVDMRGAGASFGKKRSLMMEDVVRDGPEILDWIVAQPWSNGKVGSTGISALGMTSLWLATTKHPALHAIAPRCTVFDIYRSTHPYGLLCNRFLEDIGQNLRAMDENRFFAMGETMRDRLTLRAMMRGVRPVDDDKNRSLLSAAVAQHADNEAFDLDIASASYRDSELPIAGSGATLSTQSPVTFTNDLKDFGIPIYAIDGWVDAAFAREMMSLYNTLQIPGSQLTIGPWAHGCNFYDSPQLKVGRRTDFEHTAELVRFFDKYLRDEAVEADVEAPVHYFTMGEERWKSAASWPPAGISPTNYFLGEGGVLNDQMPSVVGEDTYRVDFTAGTGVWSRFGKMNSGGAKPARYPDRALKDRALLTYTSDPLEADLEVTGHPIVHLFMRSSTSDGAVFVYLEDVAPSGNVLTVTEGYIRLSHRDVASEPPPFWNPGPWHRGNQSDVRLVEPGAPLDVEFDLFPVSWLFRKGHAIRVAVAGADKDNFARVPESGVPVFSFLRGGASASQIELPVMRR